MIVTTLGHIGCIKIILHCLQYIMLYNFVFIMEYLLDDGRVVLTLGGDPAHNYAANYATIPADAFLSGSTEYTEMEFVG